MEIKRKINYSNLSQWKDALKASLLVFLALRLWTSLVLLILIFLPPRVQPVEQAILTISNSLIQKGWFSHFLLAPWYRWDSIYYLEIAQKGYSRALVSVWPPLFSASIHLLSKTFMSPLLAAILISNLSAIAAMMLFYQLAEEIKKGMGSQVLFYLAIFPTAFFLLAAYTESLYLFFTIACLWSAQKEKFGWCALFAGLAVLTRLQAVVLTLPILYLNVLPTIKSGHIEYRMINFKGLLATMVPGLTALIFVMVMHLSYGFPWPWQTLSELWFQHTGWPWEGLVGNFTSLIGIREVNTPISFLAQFYDLILFILSVVLIVLATRRLPKIPVPYLLYAWASLFMMLIKVDDLSLLVSVSRYLLVIFPLFIAQAVVMKNRLVKQIWFAFSLASQAILLILFSWWIWVA